MILTGGWGNRDGGHHLSFLNGRVFPRTQLEFRVIYRQKWAVAVSRSGLE
jgi:hypothetical protein